MQHSELLIPPQTYKRPQYPVDISRLQWDLRDATCLLKMELAFKHVAPFLTLQPKLTRLEHLVIEDWEYTHEQAQQLLCIQYLESLQVCHLLNCAFGIPLACVPPQFYILT